MVLTSCTKRASHAAGDSDGLAAAASGGGCAAVALRCGTHSAVGASSPLTHEVGRRSLPLKRRGLSRFYGSKSQSFSCMHDLCDTPFGASALALSKESHQHLQVCGEQGGPP